MQNIGAVTLAQYILAQYPQIPITPMKLQKLAWYVKVWSLVAGENCIQAKFKKWAFGPVNTAIYNEYKDYAKQIIPPPVHPPKLPAESSELINFILDNYINLSAVALSDLTHKEDPWKKTQGNQYIEDANIVDSYSKSSFAKNFLNKKFNEGKYWVLKTNSWHSFTLDMDKEESNSYEYFDSYKEYVQHKNDAISLLQNLLKKPTTA